MQNYTDAREANAAVRAENSPLISDQFELNLSKSRSEIGKNRL